MSGAVPSRLAFLPDLQYLDVGEKVRFLGCVKVYEVATGTLHLTHDYPPASHTQVIALVNIDHVLELLKSTDVGVGAWVNVIGYIAPEPVGATNAQTMLERVERASTRAAAVQRSVCVQAIMLWSAGAIRLDEYEKALRMRRADEQR